MPGGLSALGEKVRRMLSFDAERQKAFLPGEVDFFPQEGKVGGHVSDRRGEDVWVCE